MPSRRVFSTFGLGIGLVCTSAAAAVEPAEETAADLVRLPPLLVESSTGQPWLYGEVDGFEILSRCSRTTTGQLVRSFVRAHEGLDTLLPPRFRLRTEAPELLLFYDVELWPKARQEALTQMLLAQAPLPRGSNLADIETTTLFEAPKAPSREKSARENTVSDRAYQLGSTELDAAYVHRSESSGVGGYVFKGTEGMEDPASAGSPDFFSNLRLSDADIMGSFAIVSGQEVDDRHSAVTYDAVAQVLAARVPKLPSWFVAGFLSLYPHIRFGGEDIVAPRLSPSIAAELEG